MEYEDGSRENLPWRVADLITTVFAASLLYLLFCYWTANMQTPLPGPRILKFTNIQARLFDILLTLSTGSRLFNHLHRRYGPVVQISRNEVLIKSPTAIRDLYAVSHRLDRPAPLVLFHNYGTSNLVSTHSGSLHHLRRKPIRSIYSLSSFDHPTTQALIRTTTARLLTHLSTRSPGPLSLRPYLRTYLYELLSPLIYGPSHALSLFTNPTLLTTLTTNDDAHQSSRLNTPLVLIPAFFPHLTLFLRSHNLAPLSISGTTPPTLVADQLGRSALTLLKSSPSSSSTTSTTTPPTSPTQPEPLIARLHTHLTMHGPSPAVPSEEYILSDSLDHLWAGVSTTADALVPLFNYLAGDKERQRRLRQEIWDAVAVAAREEGRKGKGGEAEKEKETGLCMEDTRLRKLKYLDAVIRETLRLRPPIPVSVARRAPTGTSSTSAGFEGDAEAGGVEVCGHGIPPGMVVGASPLVVGRDEDVFERAGEWWPERWLVGEEEQGEVEERVKARRKLQEMKTCSNFAFGAGPRMCLGVNVAWGAMRAAVAGVVGRFELEVAEETKDGGWKGWWGGKGVAGGEVKVVLREIGEQIWAESDR